jgi:Zn-dependent protease
MGPSLHFRVSGLRVRCHAATPIALGIMLYGFDTADAFDGPAAVVAFAGGLALVLAALALHEVCRVLAFRGRGVRTRRIDLLVAGGSPWVREAGNRPTFEVLAGLVGLVTIAFLALLAVLARAASQPPRIVHQMLHGAAPLLVAIALVQTLPSLPFDGGRMVRALVWYLSGDRVRGSRAAALYGQLLATAMIAGGCLLLTAPGTWPYWGFGAVVLGVQTIATSVAAVRDDLVQEAGRTCTLGEIGLPAAHSIPAGTPIAEAAPRLLDASSPRWLVLATGGKTTAVASRRSLRRLPRRYWPERAIGEIGQPLAELLILSGSLASTDALERLEQNDGQCARVAVGDSTAIVLVDEEALRSALETRAAQRSEGENNRVTPVARR